MSEAQEALDALIDPELPPTEWEFARAVVLVAKRAKISIATAESLTGGLLSSLITSVPGSSEIFQGGVVAYTNFAKQKVLNIENALIQSGVVSTEVALAMATNVSEVLDSTLGLACTGVAGPDTQNAKPVGEVHIAVFDSQTKSSRTQTMKFSGSRDDIRSQTCLALLGLCLDVMLPKTDLSRKPLGE